MKSLGGLYMDISKTNEKGFTLVELMLVFSIIILLISIFAPNMYAIMNRARNADAMNNARRFQQTLEEYAAEAQEKGWLQSYPKDAAALMASESWRRYTLKNPYYASANQFDRLVNLLTLTGEAYAGGGGYAVLVGAGQAISFQNNPVSDGSCAIIIPTDVIVYRGILITNALSSTPQFKGTLVYYPYKSISTGNQTPPTAPNDAIAGYEIRAVDSACKFITGIKLSGGEPFQP